MNLKKAALLSMASTLLLAPMAVSAYEAGDMVLRGGLATVAPDSKSDNIVSSAAGETNGQASADDDTQIGISGTYMFTENWGLEVLAATPFEHDLEGKGSVPVVGSIGGADLGSTKHLPPTVSAQYFFMGKDSQWQPYVGLGINYTTFFSEKVGDDAKGLNYTSISLDDSVGLAVSAGVDYVIDANWGVNFSMMYADIGTEATLKGGDLGTLTVDYDLDPMVYRLNAVYKF